MKNTPTLQSRKTIRLRRIQQIFLGLLLCLLAVPVFAQEEAEEAVQVPTDKPVKATFESALIIDNQTVMVPIKNTFEFDIQHRFGTLQNGIEDAFGLYAPSNIRMGFLYVPINNLSVGLGFTKAKTLVDFSAKYALLKQRKSWRMPVSVTYFVNMAVDPRKKSERPRYHPSDRLSYFHQLIVARKINDKLSIQVAPSLSHYNLQVDRSLKNNHFAIAVSAQLKVTEVMSLILNVDQPLSKYPKFAEGDTRPNPNPNVSFGIQLSTSSHAFQIFLGNYDKLVPQENNMYFRGNNYQDNTASEFFGSNGFFDHMAKRFRIGFNVTRLWNY
ncbi:MAG: hypothetical protein KA165_15015 [Saprospiraceae bacterium]|nr:hypothetical protein [Saprospiraceae bacterium]